MSKTTEAERIPTKVTELNLDPLSDDETTRVTWPFRQLRMQRLKLSSTLLLWTKMQKKRELRNLEKHFDPAASSSLKGKSDSANSDITSMQQLIMATQVQVLDPLVVVSTDLGDGNKEVSHKAAKEERSVQNIVHSLKEEFNGYSCLEQSPVDGIDCLSQSSKMAIATPVPISTQTTMAVPAADSVYMVLHDANLICEIFLHLANASNLVRAASVNKFWLATASDPYFLNRFHELHVPCLLGYYIVANGLLHPHFVTLGHPPELRTMTYRLRLSLTCGKMFQ